MLDINREAERSLIKTGFTLEFHHPKKETPLPCVTFFTISESPGFSADNAEAAQVGYIQVDIWAKKASQCGDMAVKVNEVLNGDGWNRVSSADVPDDDDIYHKAMRFEKNFNL